MSSESTIQTRSKQRKTGSQVCEQTLQLPLQADNSMDDVLNGDNDNMQSSVQRSYMLKNFKVIDIIGSGGFGTVFECQCKTDNNLCAIKKVPFQSERRETVFKELKFLSQLDFKFVVKYINSWVEENFTETDKYENDIILNINSNNPLNNPNLRYVLHIQMELCALTLKDVIKILSKDQTLSIIGYYVASELFKEILECVQYLHSQTPPIIHRDLKPENFLINFVNNRFVKLSDFGLSTFHEFIDQSHTAGNVGTMRYIAPEVTTPLANTSNSKIKSKYTTKADCYSLGIILQDLFHFDSRCFPVLNAKMIKIEALSEDLHSFSPNKRSNCDVVLRDFEFMRLTDSEIETDNRFMQIVNNSSNSYSIDNQFIEFFVHNKYKFSARPLINEIEHQNKKRKIGDNEDTITDKSDLRFVCIECDQTFKEIRVLKQHMSVEHMITISLHNGPFIFDEVMPFPDESESD